MSKITLDKLKIGKSAKIISVNNEGSIRRRFFDLGIVPNGVITALLSSPFSDPIAYRIKNAVIAIRKCDSCGIEVLEI